MEAACGALQRDSKHASHASLSGRGKGKLEPSFPGKREVERKERRIEK